LHRKKLANDELPPSWLPIIERRFPFSTGLADDERERFLTQLKVFVWEKDWVGVDGLEVTDEMKIAVAGSAAQLARNLPLDVYEGLGTIIMHPGHLKESDDGVVLGQAHRLGAVSLSWDAVKSGLANTTDGLNVALHELAHVLDVNDGDFDGTPPLEKNAERRAWAGAFAAAFRRLRADDAHGVMRAYGATNEAEFFAVATELFFENPRRLHKKEPALYEALARFYAVDPAGVLATGNGDDA